MKYVQSEEWHTDICRAGGDPNEKDMDEYQSYDQDSDEQNSDDYESDYFEDAVGEYLEDRYEDMVGSLH